MELGQCGRVDGGDGGCGQLLHVFFVAQRTRVGQGVQGVGQGADQHPDGTGFGGGAGASTALVERPSVRGARVDEQGVHGPVEEHDVSSGVQGVQGVQVAHHQQRPLNPSVVGRGNRPPERRDVEVHGGAVCREGLCLGHVATGPCGHLHGHDVAGVHPVAVHPLLSPRHGTVGAGRPAESVPNVLAQHPQILVRLPVGEHFVEDLPNEKAVGWVGCGLGRRLESGRHGGYPQGEESDFHTVHDAR